jgi:ketosteroid isomerase-like protein
MSVEGNKRLIRDMFGALSKGNAAGFLAGLSDDVTFTLIGSTRFSGTLRGKREVIDRLLTPLGAALDGGIALRIERMIGEDDWVVVLSRGQATAKGGTPYCNTYCHAFRVAAGKVCEAREYFDTQLANDALGPPRA